MDQDESAAGPELTDASERTPEQVRAEIEQTRAELGDTVAALAEKTDVKAQAKQTVDDAKQTVTDRVSEIKQNVTDKKDDLLSSAQEATPASAGEAGGRVKAWVGENTVAVVAVSGFALGWLIRSRTGR
jgi:gas vesicle protein